MSPTSIKIHPQQMLPLQAWMTLRHWQVPTVIKSKPLRELKYLKTKHIAENIWNKLTGRRPCPPPFLCPCRWWSFSCCTVCAWCTWAGHSGAGRSSWRPPARGAAAVLPGRGPPPPQAPGRWTGILLRQGNTHSTRNQREESTVNKLGSWTWLR